MRTKFVRLQAEQLEDRVNPTEFWWFPTDGSQWSTMRSDGTTNWREFQESTFGIGDWVQAKAVPGKGDTALFSAKIFATLKPDPTDNRRFVFGVKSYLRCKRAVVIKP